MRFRWPDGFERIPPAAAWTRAPLDPLALGYDAVGKHGWYANLDPTADDLARSVPEGGIVLDYSGGTGLLIERLLARAGERAIGVVNVDSSAKFLRVALERFREDERVAFRLIRWLKDEKRLQYVTEVLGQPLLARGVDAVASANAIHLYYDLDETLRSWARVLRARGRAFIQSGNILNPDAPPGAWIIDRTVEAAQEAARALVREEAAYARFRAALEDEARMAKHDALRRKFFLPPRALSFYVEALARADLAPVEARARVVRVETAEWAEFLAVYHEGILGWAGGTERVEGRAPGDEDLELRKRLLREALDRALGGARAFDAAWTYITCERGRD